MKWQLLTLFLLTMLISCGKNDEPSFIIKDKKSPNEALAVFPPRELLKKHEISEAEYEAFFYQLLDGVGQIVAEAVAEMFIEPANAPTEKSKNKPRGLSFENRVSPKAFQEILDNTWVEVWELKADGSHSVKERFRMKRGNEARSIEN